MIFAISLPNQAERTPEGRLPQSGRLRLGVGFTAFLGLIAAPPAYPDEKQPLSQGAETTPARESSNKNTELVVRLGNESNKPDGIFGPLTYGLRGTHTFQSGMAVEAGYIRLHEPGTPPLVSALDEAQLTGRLPEYRVLNQPLAISATAWKNRMIDMYTNVGGVEVTRVGLISVTGGFYFGTATREDLGEHFMGGQLTLSGSIGPVELSLGHMNGRIDQGYYRKSAFEVGIGLFPKNQLPITWTTSIEDRFYDFGKGGPVSSPDDELILINGVELHLEKLVLGSD